RRIHDNFALDHARSLAAKFKRPVLVFEPLRHGYRHASDRLHSFVLDGMVANASACQALGLRYYPFVERADVPGKGLLAALAEHACAVVTDDFPDFFLPRMIHAASAQVRVKMDMVDSNGLLPLRAGGRLFGTAASFRRHMQRAMPDLLSTQPTRSAKGVGRAVLPAEITRRWPAVTSRELTSGRAQLLAGLPIDHRAGPVATRGGAAVAEKRLAEFLAKQLASYAEDRNHPDRDGTSGLSPYLHFGHISAHRVVQEILASRGFDPTRLGAPKGQREGFWGLDTGAEAVLDQLLVWRELAFNFAHYAPLAGKQPGRFEALPEWSRKSLVAHAADPRPYVYTHEQFEAAQTDDPLWNAAQRQLVHEGTIHNALRMLWGKKILEWSPDPVSAHQTMLELNNRWALDGRDPNSNAGIGWILGRYDRPWGPRRPIFGLIRFMSTASTSRKRKVREYLQRYGPQVDQLNFTDYAV
ncbi:MAG: deoxyribodipyrimidine photolyase, partial [Nannocystaceae bacterium]